MLTTELTRKELEFMSQSDIFLDLYLKEKGLSDLSEVEPITARLPFPLDPVLVEDFRNLQNSERAQIVESYNTLGVAHIIVLNPDDAPQTTHPLLDLCEQLKEEFQLYYPLQHPLDGRPETVSRFGPHDGTTKLYNLPKFIDGSTHREGSVTSEALDAHMEGIGTGGTIQTIGLYMDSPPLFGGYLCFFDIVTLAIELAKTDMDAFRYLFLPDAMTAVRPKGRRALKVVTPVLYLNEDGQPQAFFRSPTGEFEIISWRKFAPLERAQKFLYTYAQAFAPGSYFVPYSRKGQLCFSRNRDLAHGRTGFIDGPRPDQQRVMSRKWYVTADKYKANSVPGMVVHKNYAPLFPEIFGEDTLVGDWSYDEETGENRRVQ
jgi:hypothetical protein